MLQVYKNSHVVQCEGRREVGGIQVSNEFDRGSPIFHVKNACCGKEPQSPFPVHSFMFAGIKELFFNREVVVPWNYIPQTSALGDFTNQFGPAGSYTLLFDIKRTRLYWTGDQKQHSAHARTWNKCDMCDGPYEDMADRWHIGEPWSLLDILQEYESHRVDCCRHLAAVAYDKTCFDLLKVAGEDKLSRTNLSLLTNRANAVLGVYADPNTRMLNRNIVNTDAQQLYSDLVAATEQIEDMNVVYKSVSSKLLDMGLWLVPRSRSSATPQAQPSAPRLPDGAAGQISENMLGRLKVPLNQKHKYALGRPLYYCSAVDPYRDGLPVPVVVPTGMHSTGTFCKTVTSLISVAGVYTCPLHCAYADRVAYYFPISAC